MSFVVRQCMLCYANTKTIEFSSSNRNIQARTFLYFKIDNSVSFQQVCIKRDVSSNLITLKPPPQCSQILLKQANIAVRHEVQTVYSI